MKIYNPGLDPDRQRRCSKCFKWILEDEGAFDGTDLGWGGWMWFYCRECWISNAQWEFYAEMDDWKKDHNGKWKIRRQ